jgi:hypothetical protein
MRNVNVVEERITSQKNGQDLQSLQSRKSINKLNFKTMKRVNFRNSEVANIGAMKVFLVLVAMIGFGIGANAQDDIPTETGTDIRTVNIPEEEQNRKDVIVVKGGVGFQTKITHIDDKRIYYIRYKRNGSEKEKKIKIRAVSHTLTFDEKSKQEKYPAQMNMQDYLSLPIYMYDNRHGVVFGTDNVIGTDKVGTVFSEL